MHLQKDHHHWNRKILSLSLLLRSLETIQKSHNLRMMKLLELPLRIFKLELWKTLKRTRNKIKNTVLKETTIGMKRSTDQTKKHNKMTLQEPPLNLSINHT